MAIFYSMKLNRNSVFHLYLECFKLYLQKLRIMKKGNYLLTMVILCIALLSSQSMVAKKVFYLDHQYNSEVKIANVPQDDDNKIDLSKCYYRDNQNFGIRYANGNILKMSRNNYDEYPTITIKGKDCFFILYPLDMNNMEIEKVIKGERQLPKLSTPWGSNEPYKSSFRIGVFNKGNLSEDEINNIIKESVLPMFDIEKTSKALVFRYCRDSELLSTDGSGPFISAYINGEYKTNTDIAKADAKQEAELRQKLYKEYGKPYVDAALKGQLIVGTPEKLLLKLYDDCRLKQQTANRKIYYIYTLGVVDTSTITHPSRESLTPVLSKIVWVQNGKVTKIINQ